jgi:hypothetical protein
MNDEAISPSDVLQTVAEATGGEENLAALLEIDLTELKAWLYGTPPPPFGACIHALAVLGGHRPPSPQEQPRVLSTGAAGGALAGNSVERFLRLAGVTSLVFTVGLFLLGQIILSSFTKLIGRPW